MLRHLVTSTACLCPHRLFCVLAPVAWQQKQQQKKPQSQLLLLVQPSRSQVTNQHTPRLFGEVNPRGGYSRPYWDSLSFQDRLQLLRDAWLDMPASAARLKDYYLYSSIPFKPFDVRHSDFYYIGNFPRDGGHDKWIVTRDSHYGEGYSSGEFVPSPGGTGTGIFRGVLSTRVPQNGIQVRAGYVNVRSPYACTVMKRPRAINLSPLNCVVIRYRGDGRKYLLNMHRSPLGKIDLNLFDLYSFPLFTRGGPYWTVCKIPVSKLIRNYKGRTQDQPRLNDLGAYQNMSITLADGNDGPFSLEIEYVAVYYDATLTEKFAYEIYPVSSLMKKNLTWS